MSNKTLAELKARFETGDQPTGQDFIDLIDSLSGLNTENFPDPLPAVSGANLQNIPVPDPLPKASAENLYNVIADEWQVITAQVNYVDANNFNVLGDWTSKFYKTRRLRMYSGGVYLYTTAAAWAYDAGNDLTTVTLTDPLPNNTLEEAAFSLFSPTSEGGAITPAMLGLQANFAVSPDSPYSMNLTVAAGSLWDGVNGGNYAQQAVGPFAAPAANPRIDRVVLDRTTGVASILAGTEDPAPTPPAITDTALIPLLRVNLYVGMTEITGDDITDERPAWVLATPGLKDHGQQGADYTVYIDDAPLQIVEFTAAATLTIAANVATAKCMLIVKNGANAVALAGVDTNAPAISNAASTQDFLGLAVSFGKITCVGFNLGAPTA